MAKKIKLILTENVRWYWNKGTIVEVSYAYAENVLLKQGKAKIADKTTINNMEQKEEKKHKQEEIHKSSYLDMLNKIEENWWIKIERQATEMNHLYDKVDKKDISKWILMNYQVKIPETSIKLDEKIEYTWDYEFFIDHEWVKKKLKLVISRK